MTLQQLRYIVAIDRFRNFARAADACDISQPTLSAMLIKLEEELDVRIFERTNKSVKPTTEGEKIILQAQKTLMEAGRITEIVNEGKGAISGSLTLSVGPTIAPYLLPKFIKHYRTAYPSVSLSILEMKANFMHEALLRGEIDAGIAICDNAKKRHTGSTALHREILCVSFRRLWTASPSAASRKFRQRKHVDYERGAMPSR